MGKTRKGLKIRKFLAALICLLIGVSLSPAAFAASTTDKSFEASLASQLNELGLFLGVGNNGDGSPIFDIDRAPTRTEALAMLVRALGKDTEAKTHPKTHPFTDVPEWADGYVSYAYDNGLAKGMSKTSFGAQSDVSAEMYLTFMLRALGYSDDTGDFTWNSPWALAAWCGILPSETDRADFLRADVVKVTCAALFAHCKGTQTMLHEKLSSEGVFTPEQFNAVFTDNPFADFRLIDNHVSDAIAAHETLGLLDNNIYATESHIITDMAEDSGTITVSALVCYYQGQLNKDNTIGSGSSNIGLWLIVLDADTYACKSCRTAEELMADGLSLEDCFSEGTLSAREMLREGMPEVCILKTQMQIVSGSIGYKRPSYEKALANVTDSLSEVSRTLETTPCTILLGWLGGVPHGPYACLYLIYKPNSVVGEGEAVPLPMPPDNAWGRTTEPDKLWLGEDGLTLYYSYYYDQRSVIDEGLLSEQVLNEAGTYLYTVDLNTGVTSLSILSD